MRERRSSFGGLRWRQLRHGLGANAASLPALPVDFAPGGKTEDAADERLILSTSSQ